MQELEEYPFDSLLEELLALEEDVKPKVERIKEIKEWCKDLGTFSTKYYVCAVLDRTRTGMVALEKAEEILGRKFLEERGLINTSAFKVVSISPKTY